MDYRVVLRPAVEHALGKLPREAQARLLAKAQSLARNPRPHGVKKLQGQLHLYRIKVGNYRIVYAIDDAHHLITITIIADRKESYRGL